MHPRLPRTTSKFLAAVALLGVAAVSQADGETAATPSRATAEGVPATQVPEPHLRNIRQLTFGGQNAESYFSHDGKRLIFQSTRDGRTCDQQYVMNADGSNIRQVSNGRGKTTCGYFMDG